MMSCNRQDGGIRVVMKNSKLRYLGCDVWVVWDVGVVVVVGGVVDVGGEDVESISLASAIITLPRISFFEYVSHAA